MYSTSNSINKIVDVFVTEKEFNAFLKCLNLEALSFAVYHVCLMSCNINICLPDEEHYVFMKCLNYERWYIMENTINSMDSIIKSDRKNRTHVIHVRLTDEEYDALKLNSIVFGTTISDYLRRIIVVYMLKNKE